MIDNVCLLINGTLNRRQLSELVPKCHPLGRFEQMEAVTIAQDRFKNLISLSSALLWRNYFETHQRHLANFTIQFLLIHLFQNSFLVFQKLI